MDERITHTATEQYAFESLPSLEYEAYKSLDKHFNGGNFTECMTLSAKALCEEDAHQSLTVANLSKVLWSWIRDGIITMNLDKRDNKPMFTKC